LAIVGFDDIPLAALVTPALTTCSVPRYDLGGKRWSCCWNALTAARISAGKLIVEPELIVRASA
jgi:DNA-binding LacI/PurR family transcriptional regulator